MTPPDTTTAEPESRVAEPVLAISGVSHRYNDLDSPLLSGIDLDITPGEIVALIGPSGSGKSTLLQLAGGMLDIQEGSIRVAGTELRHLGRDERTALRATSIGFIFQAFNLLPGLTALENVQVPLLLTDAPLADRAGRAVALLEQVGLSHRASHRVNTLSGGEMQRTAIARALANRPRLILADEPTGNLDADSTSAILDVLLRAVTEDQAMLIVTHDPEVGKVAHRVVELNKGRIAGITTTR